MLFVGVCVHLLFLFSIFDIYFKSPIVRNVVPYQPQHEPVADRLVLFIADGLRAETFVNHTTMSYLRSVANSHGRWGISNTRSPTESRPGHVAIIAGFYEDPSAVLNGWKKNPVDFDSVFNRTSHTWSWGSYDVANKYTYGTLHNHIYIQGSRQAYDTFLDSVVFNDVKTFFANAKKANEVKEKLRTKKIVFLVYLFGPDRCGHNYTPNSTHFYTTVKFIDQGIKEVEEVIRDFYNDDGKTTFLMTADHGMTDSGYHGKSDVHETQTPYVLWGAGVSTSEEGPADPETEAMSLNHRSDIKQADLAPLMSTILSIPIPVNSIGGLHVHLLNMTMPNKAKAIYSHSRQLASQYNRKKLDVEANAISLLYKPFEPFSTKKFKEIIEFTERLLMDEEYEKLIYFSEEITQLSLAGLTYYQNYYQRPLLALVTASFMGWIAYLLKVLLEQQVETQVEPANTKNLHIFGSHLISVIVLVLLCFVSVYIVYAQKLPLQYYLHFLMPIFLWWLAFPSLNICSKAFQLFRRSQKRQALWIKVLCYGLGSMTLGMSFTHRWMLSIPLMGMGLWPFFSSIRNCLTTPILVAWPASCAILGFFSFVPVIGKEVFIDLVILAGCLWLLVMVCYTWKVLLPLYHKQEENCGELFLAAIQACLLVLSLHNVYVQQSKRFENGTPISYFYKTLTRMTAVITFVLPLSGSRRLICRLMTINTSLLIFYLLLSVSHEGLFLVTLNLNAMCWILIELRLLHLGHLIFDCIFNKNAVDETLTKRRLPSMERSVGSEDFRKAFFFLTYIILAFFGTQNIASVNSFEIRWVTCFITFYNQLIWIGLIILKTLTPFLTVACSFRGVQLITEAPSGYLKIIVLIYSSIMGIQLLYYVKNTGSWLEIGTSISQFVLVQIITLFMSLINQIAKVMTDFSVFKVFGVVCNHGSKTPGPG